MEELKLNKKIKVIWYIRSAFVFLSMLVVGLMFFFIFKDEYLVQTLIIAGTILFLMLVFLIVYPLLKYQCYTYSYNEKKIIIKKGVIFKETIIVPVCQIQDLHISQGPIMQMMGLSEVEISTAGSNYRLTGLILKEAKVMVDYLDDHLEERIEELKNETLH